MIRMGRGRQVSAIVLIFLSFCGTICAKAGDALQEPAIPVFSSGVEFVIKTFDQYPMVAFAVLSWSDELHGFLRALVLSPVFTSRFHTIIVVLGNHSSH